jgi:hypothetical protein
LVLAFIALALSFAGTAYAGIQVGRNSVGTFQLRDGAVTTSKLRDGAVTAVKVSGCPSNSIAIGPGCVEAGLRPAKGYGDAVATGAAVGGRLPFVAELAALAALGRPLGNPELVADHPDSDRGDQLVLFQDARTTVEEPIDTQRRFRCVTSPV